MKRLTLAVLLGWLLLGPAVPASAAAGDVPPRPLTSQGLTNLTALTRLIGYVRFFHPSDQVAGLANADWDALAMAGVQWTRQIVFENAPAGNVVHLGQPWALRLPVASPCCQLSCSLLAGMPAGTAGAA